ncbi:MAG: hypothetical protein AAF546_04390 [Verrucomicrobiota bacterium]
MRVAKFLFSFLWVISALGRSDDLIDLWIEPSECFPGDVIEIHAKMEHGSYAEFELNVPVYPNFHYVASTREPLRYNEGLYTQKSVLLLQPIEPGSFELDGISVTLNEGEKERELPLPALKVSVLSYAAEDSTNELETFAPAEEVSSPTSGVWLATVFLGIVLLVFLIAVFFRRPKTSVAQGDSEEANSMQELLEGLERGEIPTALIERLLALPEAKISDALRGSMEAMAYSKHKPRQQLIDLLKAEVKG